MNEYTNPTAQPFNEKDIEAFMAHVDAAMFHVNTTAFSEERFAKPVSGGVAYNTWVDQQLTAARLRYEEEDVYMPFAILQRSDGRRIFAPDDDENNAEYYARIQREAASWEPTWLFVSAVAPATLQYPESDEVIELAEAINWYTECIEPKFRSSRAGVIKVVEEDCLTGEIVEGEPLNASPFFRQIMGSLR